ncbi:MAG: hypothetical protein Q8Q12_12265 [bacterium]|nr:hypothetical protein [bacterium]
MAFDWKEYLELSRFLAGETATTPGEQAAHRSAVSRAYYAAFCHARNYARDRHGFSPEDTAKDHSRVRDHFRARGSVELARRLDSLRRWRNDCDYKDTVVSLPRILVEAIEQAQGILDRLT